MAWIFWIIKRSALFLLSLSLSCSSSKKREGARENEVYVPQTAESALEKTQQLKLSEELKPHPHQSELFVDRTKEYGLEGIKSTQNYAVDFNNDGWTDLVVLPNFYSTPVFYQFSATKNKFEAISYNPFQEVLKASYLIFFDVNRDGVRDLFVGTFNQRHQLTKPSLRFYLAQKTREKIYYNEVKSFDIMRPWPTPSAALVDANLDGKVDVFLAQWFDQGKPLPDELYIADAQTSWRRSSTVLSDEHKIIDGQKYPLNAKASFGVSVCDIDQNGHPDILTSSASGYPNKLWQSKRDSGTGSWRFVDQGASSGYAQDGQGIHQARGGGNSFFTLCGDYNNDGLMDIYSGEQFHSYDSPDRDRSAMLTGDVAKSPGKFLRSELILDYTSANWSQSERRGAWIDVDNDGLMDFVIENTGFPPHTRLILFKQNQDHSFENQASQWGVDVLNPSGVVTLDLNRDGRMDILTGQSDIRAGEMETRLYLLINQAPYQQKKSLRVFLSGKDSNPHGWGSTIIVKTKKLNLKRAVEYTNGGLSSQSEEGVHFGIGKMNKVHSITVYWPYKQSEKTILTLKKTYDLSKVKFRQSLDVTLCDSGRWRIGRKPCSIR